MKNVLIDTPKFSFIKYKDNGSIDYISPIPFTVNYGNVLDTTSGEGDKFDAIVLGKKLRKGTIVKVHIAGKIEFYDRGIYDPKYICSDKPINRVSLIDKINVKLFFTLFFLAKKTLNKLRGKKGKTKLIKINFF